MTDEQWLWLYINEAVDNDIKLESMCNDCREEVTSKDHRKCIRCGKPLQSSEEFVNPNFDEERYNALKNGTQHNESSDNTDEDSEYDAGEVLEEVLDE